MTSRRAALVLCLAVFGFLDPSKPTASAAGVSGGGTEIGSNISDPNGNVYDYVLQNGAWVSVTADPGQVTRVVFMDQDNDIVAAELGGPGVLAVTLENVSVAVTATKYNESSASSWNRPGTRFVRGSANLAVASSDQNTNVSVFAIGPATVADQTLFRSDGGYRGIAKINGVTIVGNGQFGALRCSNALFSKDSGFTGIVADGVQFTGSVFIGDLDATGSATPYIRLGSASDTRVVGGDLRQTNGSPVFVTGVANLQFVAGADSNGNALPAGSNQGQILQYVPSPALPTVTSSTPNTLVAGAQVTLTGANFLGATTVRFNGVAATTFTVVSPTQITVLVPAGATAGPITVETTGSGGGTGPVFTRQPESLAVGLGENATFTTAASGSPSFEWQRNGTVISGAAGPTLTVSNVSATGIYRAKATGAGGSTLSRPAVLGVRGSGKITGGGVEVGSNIFHPNGTVYDQVLMTGTAVTVTADPGQLTRIVFIDPDDDLVTLEFSGAGIASVVLDAASGPAAPVKYNQAGVTYMKGRATVVVIGANETTNLTIYSVGRANSINQALFQDTTYDGVADIAAVAILSDSGRFGGLRTANTRYGSDSGLTGIFAPGIRFLGPITIGEIEARGTASPALVVGSILDLQILGGALRQLNAEPVLAGGFAVTDLKFAATVNSHGIALPAQTNHAQFADLGAMTSTPPEEAAGEIVVDGLDQGPSLTVSDGTSHSHGHIKVAQGANTTGTVTITHPGTTYAVSNGAIVGDRGFGTLKVQDHAQFNVTGWMGVGVESGGTGNVQVDGNGSQLRVSDGLTLGNAAEATGFLTVQNGAAAQLGGYVNVGWQGTGTFRIESGADVTLDAAGAGDGSLSIGQRSGTSAAPGGSATVIGAGSILDTDGAINVGTEGGYGVFTVDDSALADVGRVYIRNGRLNIDYFGALRTKGTGSIDIDAGGSCSLGAFTSVQAGDLNNAGTLTGYGQITAGNVNNSGLVSPGLESTGSLTVAGNFDQSSSGRARFDFGTTGTDRLVIQGNLNLDGTVEIAFAPGFTPVSGQSYQVMGWTGSRSLGSHLVFTGLTQAGGWTLLPVWTATSLSLLATNSAAGGTPQNDSFDSNANWILDLGQGSGSGWVDVQNGRLEYSTRTSPGPTAHDERDVIPGPGGNFGAFGQGSNVLVGRLTSNWAVSVDAHVRNFVLNAGATTTPRNPPGQGYYVSLVVLDLQNALFNHGLTIAARYDATWDDRPKGAVINWSQPSLYQDFDATGRTDFKLSAVYSAATRTLAAYVSIDGGTTWRLQSAFDVTAPVEAGGWGMAPDLGGPAFGFKLSANSTNVSVGPGDIFFDNFSYVGLSEGAFPNFAGGTPPAAADFPSFTWRNPLPMGGTLEAVIFAQGKFLATGSDGRVLSSADGTAWSHVGNVPMSRVLSLACSGTQYVAVGADGRICTSPDGVGWTQRAQTPNGRWLFGVAFANGTYVAVGSDILSSTDGVSWTVRASVPNANLQAVAATAGRFVAVGDNGTLLTSPDGISWSVTTPPSGYGSTQFNDVAHANGQFVAVGGNGVVLSSPDGVTWTPRTTGVNDWLQAVAYDGSHYVVTGGSRALVSTDLVTWSRAPIDSPTPLFGGAAGAGRFVLVGGGGEIWSSPTGQEWTSRGSTGGIDRVADVRYLEGGFVAVGANGLVMTSADGASWVRRSTPVGHWLAGVAKGAGVYVVASAFGDMLTSPDLATWTNRPVDDHIATNGVAFGYNRFVAVGNGGKVRTSTDGMAWTSSTAAGGSVNLWSVAALGNLFVAVGDNGKIYTSSDAATWTERASGTSMNLSRVRNLGGTLFAVGDNRTVLLSPDGITWLPIATPNDYNNFGYSFRDITRLGDGYYVASNQGRLVKTSRLSTSDATGWTTVARIASGEDLDSLDTGGGRLVVGGQGGALLDSALPVQPAAPTIVIPPLAQKAEAGTNVLLSVIASGNSPLSYQWKRDGTDVAGAIAAVLVLANAQSAVGGDYTVTVSGPGGSPVTSTPVTVTVGAPVISSGTTAGGTVGSIFTYAITATNSPTSFGATGLPAGLAINAATGVITGTPAEAGRFDLGISAANAGGSDARSLALFVAAAGADTFPSFAWRNPLPSGGTLQTVTYGQGRFFAGGVGGRVRTSPDGAGWSAAGTIPSGYVNALCATDTLLVAVGGSGVWTSPDAVVWTQRAQPSNGLNGVTFADGRYVAVGWNGTILTSTDGLAWTARNSPRPDGLQSVAGTTGRYVIAGQNGTILTSTDAVTWSIVAPPAGYESQYFNGVAFLGGRFIIVTGNDAFLTSTDGTNWVVRTTGLGDGFRAAAYDGANYVLIGSRWTGTAQVASVAVSGDLVSWSRYPLEAAAPIVALAAGGGQFVAVGVGGEIQSSANGRQWVARGSLGGAWQLYDAIFANGQFLAVGSEGWVGASTDGVSWTRRPTNSGAWLNGVAYGAGHYAAAHYGGVLTSPDGVTWTEHDFGDNTNHWGVAYANDQFVLVGDNGHIHTSMDGINWSRVTGAGITVNLQSVAALGNRFVVVGNNGKIYTSTTPASGPSWVERASGTSWNLLRVRAIDGALFAVGDYRTVLVSGDGLVWAAQQPNFNGYSNRDIVRLPDGYYVVSNGNLVKSSDLTAWTPVVPPTFGENLWAFATGVGKVIVAGEGGALLESALPAPPAAPTIDVQPQGKSFAPGADVILSVLANGRGPLGYQWMKGGSPVPGATGAVLVLPNAQLADAGRYTVVVTGGGTITSGAAVLTLGGLTPSFTGVGDLPGGVFGSQIRAASEDGRVAVGSGSVGSLAANNGSGDRALRWTPGGGATELPNPIAITAGTTFLTASDVTPDGAIIAGRVRTSATGSMRVPALFTHDGTTITPLPVISGYTGSSAAATAISADGTVVYGFCSNAQGAMQAFRWTAAGGTTGLGFLQASDTNSLPAARGVSADGSVVAGSSGRSVFGSGSTAFLYRQGSGMESLGYLPGGTWSTALGVTADGVTVFGLGDSSAHAEGELFLWTHAGGFVALGSPGSSGLVNFGDISGDGSVQVNGEFIHNAHGFVSVGHALAAAGLGASGWGELAAFGIADNGCVLWGYGRNPSGNYEGWVATFASGFLAGVEGPPTIAGQTPWQKVFAGNAATFSVSANGASGYRWERSSDGGAHWTTLADGGGVSGATTAVLTISGVTAEMNGGQFRAVVSNARGSTTAPAATLNTVASGGAGGIVQTYTSGYLLPVFVPKAIASGVAGVAAGGPHAAFIKHDGTLWTMGSDYNGQLGDGGTNTNRSTPVQVATNVAKVAASGSHTMFITTNGALWGMGANWSGKLGDGTQIDRNLPVPTATGVTAVAAGGAHTLFVKSDKVLWAVGSNNHGQLGDGTTTDRTTPVPVAADVVAVAATTYDNTSYFVKSDGTLWAMGANLHGELGDGTISDCATPVQVATGVTAVSAGASHALFLKSDHTLWGMGQNNAGQLGDGTTVDRHAPLLIATGVAQAAAGNGVSMFIRLDGTLWGMGSNNDGALGSPVLVGLQTTPVQVAADVTQVAASGFTLFIKTDGTLWAVGANTYGQLGDSQAAAHLPPLATGVSRAAAGSATINLFVKADGTLWRQQFGQVRQVPGVGGVAEVVVGAYGNRQLYLKQDSTLWRLAADNTPTQIASGVISAGAGLDYVVFLKTDGSLWGLGRAAGTIEFGDGTAPMKIAERVLSLAAAGWHFLYVTDDHTLWGMGTAWQGLVPGDNYAQAVTAPIYLESDVAFAAASADQNLYVRTDGTLWTRGQGWSNAAGPATQVDSSVVAAASGGNNGSLYLKADGILRLRAGVKGTLGAVTEVAGGVTAISGGVDGWAVYLQTPGFGTAPAITTPPQSTAATAGAALTLQTVATGSEPLGYQWFKDGVAVSWACAAQYPIPFVTAADAGGYTLQITNSAGNVTSGTAVVAVTGSPITTQPVSRSVGLGGGVTFTVGLTGSGPFTYQWTKNGVALTDDGRITGAATAILAIANVTVGDPGAYAVMVGGGTGSATSAAAFLTVLNPTSITGFSPAAIFAGARVTITGTDFQNVTGVRFNGVDAAAFHVDSATQITATAPANVTAGVLSLLTPAGTVTSASPYSYEAGPGFNAQPQNVAVISGQAASFEVTAGGHGTLSYQWRRFGYPIAGATARTYAIPTATRLDADYYDVVVTDAQGSATSKMARLDVAPTTYPGQLGIDADWSVPVESRRVSINQIVALTGGGYLVAGDLVSVDAHRTGAIARFAANGAVDATFTSPIKGVALRIAVQADGKILAAGPLTVETAGSKRAGLVRLNADGSLDETFNPPSTGDGTVVAVTTGGMIYADAVFGNNPAPQLWRLNSDGSRDGSFISAYAPGTYLRTIALQADGNLLVSAVNSTAGSSIDELGRLLAADGSRDSTFTPPVGGYVPNLLAGPSGKIYVTGFFGTNSGPEICGRLNADGTWDGAFARLPVNGSIRALTLEAGGSVVIAGDFFQIDGNPRAVIARLNADGTLAASQPEVGTDVGMVAIAALPSGELLAAERDYSAATSTHLVRVKTDNSLDRSADPILRATGVIKSIVRQSGGRLVVAGDFNTIAGVERRYLARLDAAGAVDLSFAPGGGPNGMVQALKQQGDGTLLAMGVFTEVDGVSRPAWARLSADGVRDPSFSGTGGVSASGQDKYALLPLPGGGAIVSSWWFNEIFSGGCIRLNPDGSYDAAFTAALGGSSGHPIASLVQPDGKMVLGGFGWFGRNSTLMRLNPDGSVDHNYGLLLNPLAAAVTADDRLWVATPDGLWRFLPDGQPDGSFHFPGPINFGWLTVPDLVPQNDGKMIVPAQINIAAVTSSPVPPGPGVLRVNADGSLDPTFGVAGLRAPATAIVQDDSGRLYLATDGALRRTRALAAPAIETQPVSTTADPGASVILGVAATGDYVSYQWFKDGVALPGARAAQYAIPAVTIADAGTYTVTVTNNAGSVTSAASVLRVSGSPITMQPAGRAVGTGTGVTFTVGTAGAGPFTYRWTKNGASVDDDGRITGTTTATLSIANVTTGDAGAYAVVVGHGGGSATSGAATLAVVDAHATHAVASGGYGAGGSVTITSTVTYAGVLSSLGWSVLPPAGWSYSASAGQAGDVKPTAGDTDLLEWAWTTVPPSPVTFSYTLYVPMGTNGTQGLTALVLPRQAGTQFQLVVQPDPLAIGPLTYHSADTNHDFRLSLIELLRVIELYNTRNGTVRTGCYTVDVTNAEDGFATADTRSSTAVVTLAQYHSADSNRDGKLSLTELLRMIELYNYRNGTVRTGQYHVDPLSPEDGFAPGPVP